MSHRPPPQQQIPEVEPLSTADFRERDNDLVVRSRQDHKVDLTDALRVGPGIVVGGRNVDDPLDTEEPFDSERDVLGNAGIARRERTDSRRW